MHEPPSLPRALAGWIELGLFLSDAAAAAAQAVWVEARRERRRRGAYRTRRPGGATPLWNALLPLVRAEVARHGEKVRLARYLGIPKQRLTDFLTGRRRLPDAEITLRLIAWLAQKRQHRTPEL